MTDEFTECATCASKPGTPTLCDACLANRDLIASLKSAVERYRAATTIVMSIYRDLL